MHVYICVCGGGGFQPSFILGARLLLQKSPEVRGFEWRSLRNEVASFLKMANGVF